MKKLIPKFTLLALATVIFASCHMGRSNYMTEEQRQQLETAYDSLQSTYKTLVAKDESSADSIPANLQSLYARMQQMHSRMETNHRQDDVRQHGGAYGGPRRHGYE